MKLLMGERRERLSCEGKSFCLSSSLGLNTTKAVHRSVKAVKCLYKFFTGWNWNFLRNSFSLPLLCLLSFFHHHRALFIYFISLLLFLSSSLLPTGYKAMCWCQGRMQDVQSKIYVLNY